VGSFNNINVKRNRNTSLLNSSSYEPNKVNAEKTTTFQDLVRFEEEIQYLHNLEVINGSSETTFKPLVESKRVDAVRMIIREMDVDLTEVKDPNFTDVSKEF